MLRVREAPSLRFDGGISPGQVITPAFDSMLAQARGFSVRPAPPRQAPWRQALHQLVLLGVPTNIDYLARVLRHSVVSRRSAAHRISRSVRARTSATGGAGAGGRRRAGLALADTDFRRAAFDVPEPHATIGDWRS